MKSLKTKTVIKQQEKLENSAGKDLSAKPPARSFMKTVRIRAGAKTAPDAKQKKRENNFSKSRDTREDRSARQMKTAHNSQTFAHGR